MSDKKGNPAGQTPLAAEKRPLTHTELTDIIDLCLWAGQMLVQSGANSFRVEESVHRIGTGLGCDWLDVIVSTGSLTITASSGTEFRTKTRRIVRLGVNMDRMTAVNTLSHDINDGRVSRLKARRILEEIDAARPLYNRWLIITVVGLACGAFSNLFGGDWILFLITFAAAAAAMWLRQEMSRLQFNPIITVTASAFTAGLLASSAALFPVNARPGLAMSAAVLLLIPGVPLINSAHDIIRGYTENGIARGVTGLIIALAIALGLFLVIALTGVPL